MQDTNERSWTQEEREMIAAVRKTLPDLFAENIVNTQPMRDITPEMLDVTIDAIERMRQKRSAGKPV